MISPLWQQVDLIPPTPVGVTWIVLPFRGLSTSIRSSVSEGVCAHCPQLSRSIQTRAPTSLLVRPAAGMKGRPPIHELVRRHGIGAKASSDANWRIVGAPPHSDQRLKMEIKPAWDVV